MSEVQTEATPEPEANPNLVSQIADEMERRALKARDEAEKAGIEAGAEIAKEAERAALVKANAGNGAVDAAIALQDAGAAVEGAQRMTAHAGQGGRTLPSDLRDQRYRSLGSQYHFRNADDDMTAKKWFQAARHNDIASMRRISEEANQRAAIAIGDPGANFGVADGTGAQLLPLPLSDYLQTVIHRTERMRNWARIFESGEGNSLRIPIQDATAGNTWLAEGAAGTGQEGTVSDGVTLFLQKLVNISVLTDELLDGSAFNTGTWLAMDVGEGMAEEADLKFYQDGAGSAVDEPVGLEASDTTTTGPNLPAYFVASNAAQVTDFTAVGVITLDFITDMYFALPENHRRNAIWSGPDTVAAILSKVVDGNGRPIFSFANNPAEVVGDNDAVGQVGTLFNRPFINMPGKEGVGQDANRLYFSAMNRTFAILEKSGIVAESSRDFAFTSGVTTFKFVRRVDGQPIGNRTLALPFDYVYGGNLT